MRYRPVIITATLLVLIAVILVLTLRGVVSGGTATPQSAPAPPAAASQANQAPSAQSVTLEGLPLSPQQTRYAFESVNGTSIPITPGQDFVVRIPRGTPLQVIGWAVDTAQTMPAGGVFLSLDNAVNTPTTYGFDRPDVAQALGKPAYTKVGFSGDVPTAQLTPGRHLLIMKIVSGDHRSYYQPQQAVAIEIV